jgi:cell wall-associated NlpC family hydrolase
MYMRINMAVKMMALLGVTVLSMSTHTADVKAETVLTAENGIAGMSEILDVTSENAVRSAFNEVTRFINSKSPYNNLGVSKADNYVNIRKKPSTDSEVVGKLYRGSAAKILETLEGDWVKIQSGDVVGYIASSFLAIGDAAKEMSDKYATKYATVVNTATLRVREKKSTDAKTLDLIPLGEEYVVVNEYDKWAEIILGTDDETGKDFTGYVSKDYVDISVEFEQAISVEEELRRKRIQEEAEKAEAERRRKLAQEEAERKEAARKAAEAAKSNNDSSNDSSESKPQSTGNSSSADEKRQEVVNYALKFVGNPYVWGGESLTRGADCSGFVQSIYRDFGYYIPRVSRDQARNAGEKVSESDLKPGDLIFYANSSGTVNHVAMYIGNGKIVQAANTRQGIITSSYKYRKIYCIRRVID